MNQSISILGCGWLGLPLAKHLHSLGYMVKGSTTTATKLNFLQSSEIEPFLINIDELTDDYSSFFESDILIINITSKSFLAYQQLVNKINQSPIKQVLFVSSTSVYDFGHDDVTEQTVVNGSLLSQVEELFTSNINFKSTIIRFGGLFGYDRQPGRFFRHGKPVEDADAVVNFIHRDDCITIIEQIIVQQLWGEVLNGVTDTHPTKFEFYTHMAKVIGYDAPQFNFSGPLNSKLVRNDKVKQLLKIQFKVSDLLTYQPE